MIERFVVLLERAQRTVFFTGAGVSTGSGIPDFRGPRGIWRTRRPVEYSEFMASEETRVRHWEYKLESWEWYRAARPGPAHRAIAALEQAGRVEAVVTQNIDGLHQAAGSRRVVELHGTNRWVECQTCTARYEPEPYMEEFRRTRRCPTCACGGWLKSATISFGQELPVTEVARALEAFARCDLAVAAGSTLEVVPAAWLPMEAVRRAVPYVVVNLGATAHDEIATLRLEGDVDEILPEAVRRILGPNGAA